MTIAFLIPLYVFAACFVVMVLRSKDAPTPEHDESDCCGGCDCEDSYELRIGTLTLYPSNSPKKTFKNAVGWPDGNTFFVGETFLNLRGVPYTFEYEGHEEYEEPETETAADGGAEAAEA